MWLDWSVNTGDVWDRSRELMHGARHSMGLLSRFRSEELPACLLATAREGLEEAAVSLPRDVNVKNPPCGVTET